MNVKIRALIGGLLLVAGLAACEAPAPLPTLMPTLAPTATLPPALTVTITHTPLPSSTPLPSDTAAATPWLAVTLPVDTPTPAYTDTPVVAMAQVTPTVSLAPPTLARILSLKSPMLYGNDVLLLQERLLALHYTEMPTPDGYYGQRTAAAVRHFQMVNGLVIDGIVGPQTWEAIFGSKAIASPLVTLLPSPVASAPAGPTVARVLRLQSPPLTGPDVLKLQKRLWDLGYFPCHADASTLLDGIFGSQTEAALRRFQEGNGLEANGWAGSEVQARLASPAVVAATFGPVALPPPADLPPAKSGYLAVVYGLDIYVLDADLGTLTYELTASGTSYDPAWSPDGGRVAYVSKHAQGDELFVVSANGAGQTQVTCSRLIKHHPVWSPDGTKILFAGTAQDVAGSGLYLMNADGTGLSLVPNTTLGQAPAWSRTNRIAFAAEKDGGKKNIYTVNPDGSDLQALTSGAGNNSAPAWSPDASQIVFASDRDGKAQLYVMNADGTNQRALSHLRYESEIPQPLSGLTWSGRIAFSLWADGTSKVGVINADGSGLIWYMLSGLSGPDWKP